MLSWAASARLQTPEMGCASLKAVRPSDAADIADRYSCIGMVVHHSQNTRPL